MVFIQLRSPVAGVVHDTYQSSKVVELLVEIKHAAKKTMGANEPRQRFLLDLEQQAAEAMHDTGEQHKRVLLNLSCVTQLELAANVAQSLHDSTAHVVKLESLSAQLPHGL